MNKDTIIKSIKKTIYDLIHDFNTGSQCNPLYLIKQLKPYFKELIELEKDEE